mmetsp:Transcript_14837/g.36967  ORF Transcript_14837/g.36967 Transcript_14837/m.36967 type:complete len:1411 (-) Transcript_14837:1858-6090(-)|eukprot:CAMPEP_0178990980 /NCGR_PEP_ID=MMETSP0795-20121207/5266_1 /TAXON_ID=88552 /ORGANISM="Amoebophrya sp., Strain Ameob2" /LENGTH=1410 /DNA_ID=CAMNT_0020682623 /DNA_START=651 /DNA_END=4883 /DNA_ORIENTATION=+
MDTILQPAIAAGSAVDLKQLTDLEAAAAVLKTALTDKKQQGNAVTLLEKSSSDNKNSVAFSLLVLQLVEALLPLTAEAKTGKQTLAVLQAGVAAAPSLSAGYLPLILSAIEKPPQNKWKVKVAALEVMAGGLLTNLASHCPKQLNHEMAHIVKILVACSKEVRAEIKNSSAKLLEQIGQLVKCTEIQALSDKIVNCLKNFGNMKLATETLYQIANTTFLSYVDAASFALLFPIVERAMKERNFDSKKNGIMIIGAAVVLIEDAEILEPYLASLLPILKELALDPTFEIQREAAKSLGSLGKNLPDLLERDLLLWAFDNLQSTRGDIHNAENERTGAAHSLSEMLSVTLDKSLLGKVLEEIVKPRALSGTFPEQRAGAFSLMEFLCKVDSFEPFCKSFALQWVLQGLRDESTLVHDHAFQAGTAMMREIGGSNADSFVFPLADAVLCFNHEHRLNSLSPKGMTIALFRQLVERVSEYRKYGTDMISMDCCGLRTRLAFVCLLQMCRLDADPEVRRQSNKVLAEQLQSVPKTKKETLIYLLASLKAIVAEENGNGLKKAAAERCLSDIRENWKDYEFTEEKFEQASATENNVLKAYDWSIVKCEAKIKVATEGKHLLVKGAHHHAAPGTSTGDVSPTASDASFDNDEVEWRELAGLVTATFEKELTAFQLSVLSCFVLEAVTVEKALHGTDGVNKAALFDTLNLDQATLQTKLAESVFKHYHPKELKTLENPEEVLCHVENLMLMYGGGHMLLKDTTFELRKGKRYGVVGRNGTGKTTLMNLIASGGVPQIPKTMTCIHVKPEVLDTQLNTKCKVFMQKENPERSEKELDATLEKVMFPEDLWNVTIGELSGGWRMRLLIAGAMMKKADVLLLDEPTNHLDFKAVNWLCDYLVGLDDSAIMVISHDPFFLNRVCTNIINYNSGKLVYYEGNFDAFTKKLGINADDAEALLAGQVAVSEEGVERGSGPGIKEEIAGGEEGCGSDKTTTPSNTLTPAVSSNSIAELATDGGGSSSTDNSPAKLKRGMNLPSCGALSTLTGASSDKGSCNNLQELAAKFDDAAGDDINSGENKNAPAPDRKAKIVFPIAGKVKGLTSMAKPVLEVKDLTYAYNTEKGDVIQGVSSKITMNSRIHIKGVNGAGKTTFMNLICGEVHPNASACPQKGEVARHRNCRLAYMAQQHMTHMGDFMESTPYIYIQKRYQNGYDGALQERLLTPKTEEERLDREKRAKAHGKYGNALKDLVGRQLRGKEMVYEAKWWNLDDSSKNTWLTVEDLKKLGCESFALAYDDRAAAIEAGLDQRPLTQREIVKHLELFGITEELALNRNIGMFSAGQKSKVSLAAAFWIKPHLVALDEPTNYIDMETLDSLTVALQRFKGGVICISHCADFASKVCNETWMLEGGGLTVIKDKDAKK